MSARADWYCMLCDEVMELPLKAVACPVCGGLLERRFTAPMVNTDFAKRVDGLADPVLAPMSSSAPAVPEAQRSRSLAPAAALGMVPGPSRQFSQSVAAPLIHAMRGRGPTPNYTR